MRFKTLSLAIALSNVALINSALAQQEAEQAENEQDVSTEEGGWGIEEIVVTATKRETLLMQTPIAISAFSEEELQRQNIRNVRDLNNIVPNMSIMVDDGQGVPIITLRGVRSTDTTEWGDPAVGMHFDGIYTPRPQAAQSLMFDVARVEALRGPQGTLFGRNSTVGAINVISQKPAFDEVSGNVQIETGKWNQETFKGWVNIPVTDNWALRVAGMFHSRDSDMKGWWDPNQYDTRWLQAAGIEFVPAEDGVLPRSAAGKENMWMLSDVYQEVEADPSTFYNAQDNWGARISSYVEFNQDVSWLLTYERYEDNSPGGAGARDCARIAHRGDDWYLAGIDGELGTGDDKDPGTCTDLWGNENNFEVFSNIPGKSWLTIDSVRSRAEWQITDDLLGVYLYGYQRQQRESHNDIDQGMYAWDMDMRFLDNDFESNVHELQLQNQGAGDLQWIVGYFYMKEDNATDGQFHHTQQFIVNWNQPERIVESQAVFGQATWEFVPNWFFTAGARYTEDSKQDIGGRNNGCQPIWDWGRWPISEIPEACHPVNWGWGDNAAGRDYYNSLPTDHYDNPVFPPWEEWDANDNYEKWSATTYRVGLDWQVTEDTLIYSYYATGYKGGGLGDVVYKFDGSRYPIAYDEENVGTFELGLKTTLMDNRLQLRANYFYTDFDDYQLSQFSIYDTQESYEIDPETGELVPVTQTLGAWITKNVDNSMIQGLELELEWTPWKNGFIGGYLTFMDTELKSDYYGKWDMEANQVFGYDTGGDIPQEDPSMNPVSIRNLKGNDLAYAPPVSFTVNLSHTFHFAAGTLTPFFNVHWEDESYTSIYNYDKWDLTQDQVAVDLRDLRMVYTDKRDDWYMVNFNLNFTSADDTWYVEGGVYNLTDEDVNWWQGFGGNTSTASKARQSWSLRLGYNF